MNRERMEKEVIIPSTLIETVFKLLHDIPSASHPSSDKTLSMARAKYYWLTMRLFFYNEWHIAQCLSCAETKGTTQTAPILEYPLPAGPFNVVGIISCSCHAAAKVLPMSMFVSIVLVVSQSWLHCLTSLLWQWLMPLCLIPFVPTRLLVFSWVTTGQNSKI